MSATVYEQNGGLLTIRPEGRLDTATAPILESELKNKMDGVQNIVMDFAGVDYVSSGCLRVLLAIQQQMENIGGSFKLVHVNEYILDVFELVGFMDFVDVEKD